MAAAATERAPSRRGRTAAAAFAAYALISFLFWGLRLLIEPGGQYIGPLDDPQIVIWAFGWFPHAILHGHNPLVTPALWAPVGINLTWTTVAPGLSILFAPVTLLVGPFTAYNVAEVLMPALSALTAFLLCRHLTRAFWPSFVGGYLFGFSAYMLGHLAGHIHMTSIFLVPLVALVLVRFVQHEVDGRGLVVRLSPLLVLQLTFSSELVFTLTLAVCGGLLLAFGVCRELRPRLRAVIRPLSLAYVVAGVVSLPYLYYEWKGLHTSALVPPQAYVADLLNFFVPTSLELTGAGWTHGITSHWPGNNTENGAFLGPVALVIVALFIWRRPRTPGARFLVWAFAATSFFALGSALHVDGHRLVPLPWKVVEKLPLWDNVLTVRFAMYVSLVVGVIVAVWAAAQPSGSIVRRGVLPALAMLALVPNPWAKVWATSYSIPRFFTAKEYRSCLTPGQRILPEPVGLGGDSMLWQVASGFRFTMAAGRIQQVPPTEFMNPRANELVADQYDLEPNQAPLIRRYVNLWGVNEIVADPKFAGPWLPVLDRVAPREAVDGVYLYRMSASAPPCREAGS